MSKGREKRSPKKRAGAPTPEQSSSPRRLTPKQERFCQAYLETGNASEAYRQAYDCGAMASATINRNAHALLENNKVAARVAAARAAIAEKHGITLDWVVDRLKRIADADIRKAIQWGARNLGQIGDKTTEDGKPVVSFANDVALISSEAMDPDTAFAISEISQSAAGVKIKFHDKRAALVDLGKHVGLGQGEDMAGTMTVEIVKFSRGKTADGKARE